MLFIDLIFVFILAVLASVVVAGGMGWRHPRNESGLSAALFIFAVLFFGLWAAGSWVPVWGPVMLGVPWLSFVLIALLFTLLFFAVAPVEPKRNIQKQELIEAEKTAGVIFGLFFWLLIPVLLVIALIAYM